jgi:hypothetical protein
LNINGSGAIRILNSYSNLLSAGSNSYPVKQSLATLVYDATLEAWIKQGGDVAFGSTGLTNGCPPELMIRLCAEVGAHPHFVTPPLAIDPATDYMPCLAEYCRANAPSWMIPRFEGPNELWNNAGGFFQTGYANAKAIAYGWGPDFHNWYGKAMSVLGQIVHSAYGGDRAKYQVLCGVQTASGSSASGTGGSDARLASTKYMTQPMAPQAPYTRSPASKWVTHVCCAQYFTPSKYGTAQELADASDFAAAVGNPALQLEIATAYANTSNSGSGPFTINKCAVLYANWKLWAQKFDINNMCGYEGGYSPDYTGGGKSQVDLLRAASKRAPSLGELVTNNYNNFIRISDAKFKAEFPSCYQLSGMTPSNNVWAILEDIYDARVSPQWNALVAFNATK